MYWNFMRITNREKIEKMQEIYKYIKMFWNYSIKELENKFDFDYKNYKNFFKTFFKVKKRKTNKWYRYKLIPKKFKKNQKFYLSNYWWRWWLNL